MSKFQVSRPIAPYEFSGVDAANIEFAVQPRFNRIGGRMFGDAAARRIEHAMPQESSVAERAPLFAVGRLGSF